MFALGNNQSDSVGTVTLANGGSITGTGTSALTSTGSFELQDGSVSAILAGSGIGLNKTGAGTVTLTGANTFSGATTLGAGVLNANASAALGDGSVYRDDPARAKAMNERVAAIELELEKALERWAELESK